jgi:hypothetical protein
MNVSGPTPLSPRLDDPASSFRVHQRFEAEVIQVSGERVTLSVGGVAIVARMTSPEQAAILTQQRKAQFQVQETGPEMRLKLVKGGTAALGASNHAETDPAAGMLRLAGLPADEMNLALARACLQNRVVITKEFIAQMRNTIEQALAPPPGEKGAPAPGGASLAQAAQSAVSWAASGRSLTPATLSLLLQNLPELTSLIASLRAGLAGARSRLSAEDAARLDQALQWLDSLQVELPAQGDLAEKLRRAIANLGRSLEAELAAAGEENQVNEEAHSGLFQLALLSRTLPHAEHAGLLSEIEQFLARLNLQNLRNTPPGLPAGQEHWLGLEIPCALQGNGQQPEQPTAVHLRILKDDTPHDQADGAGKSRFILQAEVAPGRLIEVDLSILGPRIQVYVSTPDAPTLARANQELSGLNDGLEKLGYEVQNSIVGVKESLAGGPGLGAPGSGTPGSGALSPAYRHSDWRA